MIFKLITSHKFDICHTVTLIQAISGFKRLLVVSLDEIDVIFKMITLDELDDISNLNQSI